MTDDFVSISPFFENDKDRADHHGKTSQIVPFQLFLQIDHREDAKHDQSNHFLDGFQLGGVELVMADAIRRHLEAILDKGDPPADENYNPQGRVLIYLR
jgi:hypothetical protein